jgi:hypothetical protein
MEETRSKKMTAAIGGYVCSSATAVAEADDVRRGPRVGAQTKRHGLRRRQS